MKILIAVDGSAHSLKAVQHVASNTAWFREAPQVYLLNVQNRLPPGLADESRSDYYEEEAQAATAPAEELLSGRNVPARVFCAIGDTAQQIGEFAKEHDIDLIVMGSHGHGALQNLATGSVVTRVLASTDIPVLVVR